MEENLTEKNYLLFAAKHYNVPHYIEQEFFSDLFRIKYIKRLLQKYRLKGQEELKERLILNHIIMIYNVFDTEACTKLLFYKLKPVDYSSLKPFLVYLRYMPEYISGVDGKTIFSKDIISDEVIQERLSQI